MHTCKYSKKLTTIANGQTRTYYYKTYANGVKVRVTGDEYKKNHKTTKTKGGDAEPEPTYDPVNRCLVNVEINDKNTDIVEDYFEIKNMGAYTTVSSTNFNGFDTTEKVYLC